MAVELTEAQINGRFQIVDRPLALPGKCAVCGAVDRPVVDFGFDLDDYGVVYICVDDFKAGARLLGLVDVSQLVQPSLPDEVRDLVHGYIDGINDLSGRLALGLSAIEWSSPSSIDEKSDDVQNFDGRESSDNIVDGSVEDRTSEQDSESIVVERPTSVSDSSSDGLTLFEFPN
jgi:hypothetical protein